MKSPRFLVGATLILLVVAMLVLSPALAQNANQQSSVDPAPQIIRKSGDVLAGSAVRRVEPVYPPLAKAARVSGAVVVEIVVDEQGSVISARAMSGDPLLKDAATSAARAWKFNPTILGGVPVKVIGGLTFNFDPDSPPTTNHDSEADRKLKEEDEEDINEAKAAVDANPNSAEAHFDLAEAYSDAENYDAAIDSYKQALRLKSDYEEAYSSLASLYAKLERYDEQILTYKSALEAFPNSEEFLDHLATVLTDRKRLPEAVEIQKRLVDIKPDDPRVNRGLGQLLYDLRRYEEAIAAYQKALVVVDDKVLGKIRDKDAPGAAAIQAAFHGEVLYMLGASHYMLQRYADALAYYEQAARLEPPYRSARLQREIALCLLRMGRSGESIEAAKKAIEMDPKFTDGYQALAHAYHDTSQYQQAIDTLKSGLEVKPEDQELWLFLADNYQHIGNLTEAEKAYGYLIRVNPGGGDAYLGLSSVLRRQNKPAEAETMLQKGVALSPNNANGHLELAGLFSHQGRKADAEVEYRKALELDPNNPLVLNNIGYAMLERNEKLDEALEMIRRAVDLVPHNGSFVDSLGWAYFKVGKLDEAERFLTEAAQLLTTSATVQEHLGDLYQRRGKMPEARAAWQKSLSLRTEPDQAARLKVKLSGEVKK
ncbi:MAG TPA: TonB family protein [Blastocatellia bacterium]|nr:TonB family protein [Blastocatellia bacterium]